MAIRNELIEELLAGKDPQEVFAQDGVLDELKKALAEQILNAEMDQHLASEREAEGTEPRNPPQRPQPQHGPDGSGKLELQVPRDRRASFEPQLIAKYRRRFPDFRRQDCLPLRPRHDGPPIQGHLFGSSTASRSRRT